MHCRGARSRKAQDHRRFEMARARREALMIVTRHTVSPVLLLFIFFSLNCCRPTKASSIATESSMCKKYCQLEFFASANHSDHLITFVPPINLRKLNSEYVLRYLWTS